ncbi:hypothetical protein [Vannielia sp. SX4]|uniref:hypothetical protein n=1 Tax=Vannielia sp. SX4 TaxID=3463852 RepID=UPI004058C48A
MAKTGLGRWHNVPVPGQRGFRPTRDHYDLTGEVPPRHLQCEMHDCQDLAYQDPFIRASYAVKLCEYHTRLCHRMGAPYPCDIPWPEFYRVRDAVKLQLNKVNDAPVLARAVHAVQTLPGKCYARAAELESADKRVPAYLAYGLSLRHRVEPRRFIDHHIAFGILLERGVWTPQPGYTRHADKAWLRCVHRALSNGNKAERADIGPYQASLLRRWIATDLQLITGRTDYALREAEFDGLPVLPKARAIGWYQDSLT